MHQGFTGKTLFVAALLASVGCSSRGTHDGAVGTNTDRGGAPGTSTDRGGAPPASSEPYALQDDVPPAVIDALNEAVSLDGPALLEAYPLPLQTELGYDPLAASGLDLIQASALGLNDVELAELAEQGLVISTRQQFPTFSYGFKTIYSQDLPLYVSADSILFAVHRSYDELLKRVETYHLLFELDALLTGMRSRLSASAIASPLREDLDLYLTLAHSLLSRKLLAPAAGADPARVKSLYDLATAAAGHSEVSWFGTERDEDFSQFKARGHYTDSSELTAYFRAMLLLGRVDLRLIETQSDGSQRFQRQHFDAAVALGDLIGPDRIHWENIDRTIGLFTGERDSMSPDELGRLVAKLGASDYESTRSLADATIVAEIASGDWGEQRILSRILVKDWDAPPEALPLDRAFALFGQRYSVDSHVFVNTTYDRVEDRRMPDPLDVAFAALGNDSALAHLQPQLSNSSYAAGLSKTRTLVDAHAAPYWQGSLYTTWLGALRALSPTTENLAAQPSLFSTRAAQDRVLNTQLASWAELRHDTILYTKQSYTTANACEFPDAYVDPYPEFYARLGRFAEHVGEAAAQIPTRQGVFDVRTSIESWVANFTSAMAFLQVMAENQRSGTPHGAELMEFINAAVSWDEERGCDPTQIFYDNLSGWYLKLFYSPAQSLEQDPTIADVHTQPTDAAGNDVGRVLHVGTGRARLMVATIETCNGPRAYVGLASSYGQTVEENWKRLSDPEWAARVEAEPFPDPPWMNSVLAEP